MCHEIFHFQFFSWFKPIWSPDKQANVFWNSVSISLRYLITNLSTQCATHRGDKTIFVANQIFASNLFFHHRCVHLGNDFSWFLFKSKYRQVKISILIPRCAIYLSGMLHTRHHGDDLWRNRNRIRKYFSLFIRSPDGLIHEKN